MFTFYKNQLLPMIDEFVLWKSQYTYRVRYHKDYLIDFIRFSGKKRIEDITRKDIELYRQYISDNGTAYSQIVAMSALRSFLRFCKSRGYRVTALEEKNILQPMYIRTKNVGRKPNIKKIKKVKELRDNLGMTFAEISQVMKANISLVHRWYHYPLEQYVKQGILRE